ncbi:MAG: type II toxin-antitoxin system RelE/ParE family toxin [Desulfobacterales bacterium]|nr:type II toxin-antitoxin system RelE/ParE family toxin [Desulfobacterales bacterium]
MKRIPAHYREAILENVDRLIAFPNWEHLDITELKNHPYDYRLRVGRYRVLFNYLRVVKIIEIQEVKKRDERTY